MNERRLLRCAIGLVALSALGCGVDAGVTAAGGDAGAGGTPGAGGDGGAGGGLVCPEDPAEGEVAPECGIWVSVSLGDDGGAGTQDAPVATLTRAIELAEQGPGRVYACGGETWTEALVVPGSVSLHGGFDCEAGWSYVGSEKRAMVAPASPLAMTWINPGEDTYPFMTDFHVESADAVEPGGSSIGVFVRDDVGLTIRRCALVAGNGADGMDGAPGGDVPAEAGADGSAGANACSAAVTKGGAGPESVCGFGMSKGGAGGDAGAMMASGGAPGEPVGASGGAGGLGEGAAPVCTDGQPGAEGTAGAYGFGGDGENARLTTDGLILEQGEDGQLGAPGQGGGGGGATFGAVAVCGSASPGGAAGGSGGGGGCGGQGGKRGQSGGWSVAMAERSNLKIVLLDYSLRAGNGGNGGNGGAPQAGGASGNGGKGGAGAGSIKPGCAGGAGGAGGKGGWGGGGAGGYTLCLATTLTGFLSNLGDQDVTYGTEGKPGIGDPDFPRGSYGGWGKENVFEPVDP